MASSRSQFDGRSMVLVFGSQALDFNAAFTSQLRSTLLGTPSYQWMIDTILELPRVWDTVLEAFPELNHPHVKKLLQRFSDWLRTGELPEDTFPLPNAVLTPLTVIAHLIQYLKFLERCQGESWLRDNFSLHTKYRTQTLGLCTGLLSSAAVSSSANHAQFRRYGAVAVRLAMIIGALVDIEDTQTDPDGKWKSFSISWTSTEVKSGLTRLLEEYPEAYVSVILEDNRATLSSPKTNVGALQQELKAAGFAVAEVGLNGSFHSERHRTVADHLIRFCDSQPALQFPDSPELVLPTQSNTGGDYVSRGKLHHTVVRSMLVEQSDWQQAFAPLQASSLTADSLVVFFGRERCIPSSLIRKLGPRLIQGADLDPETARVPKWSHQARNLRRNDGYTASEDAIAVVGMACNVPGGADLDGLWEALCSGKSQHTEVPAERFDMQTAFREPDPKRRWYGNFIDDHDTFDHKFFKKSPREMASTDPQHRLMLQNAYQAVEQAGYFNSLSPEVHIGCYIGVGLTDYENNIACYPANAYAATGNLKAFVAGKISHYFGWTGPSLTIDTACSSSAVAVHQACKAILTGECYGALAGGVNVMTSPEWFQNLAGASFLSPTGQCKPFDAKADGYCRAEGVGSVFLKKLSAAMADGNQVLGVIASSAVFQNENCTAITVPSSPSLSDLFRHVTQKAGLQPEQISVVEAHGTGTPVGDPAEYDGVRNVLGGLKRSNTLSLGSIKGLLGHTESASGIMALLKTLLMINKGAIPPQASFETINPSIKTSPSDNIEIVTRLKPWDVDFRAALINNYGASGSNASLVVTQAPQVKSKVSKQVIEQSPAAKYPIWLCGFDEQSLRRYSTELLKFLKSHNTAGHQMSLANLSFQLSIQSNRSLGLALIFSCSSITELQGKLTEFLNGQKSIAATLRPQSPRPVILCFGGQVSTFVGLDREVHEKVKILQVHLNQCNDIFQSLGLESVYPGIFEKSPISDPVKLQTMLFAMQYSCARTWLDCGIQVAAVVGHSFGELTAMCIAGVLSTEDTIKMIAGRARLIKDKWGPEKGSMMAVKAEHHVVESVLSESRRLNQGEPAATIACFNGPDSFTLAGSTKAIENVEKTVAKNRKYASCIKMKKLDVTNSFHSNLVDPLMSDLEKLGQDLVFREPKIHLENATADAATARPTPSFIATHLRKPVYFNHAIQRLSRRYSSSCIWLEAGSNSTITTMASRALGSPSSSYFQSVNITSNGAFSSLTDATASLWKEGLRMSFWTHHAAQITEYSPLLLPPYQFEKSKHWMELKKPQKAHENSVVEPQALELPKGFSTFVGYQGAGTHNARFRVNTMNLKYEEYVSAHVIAESAPICPSTFQLVIAIDALKNLVTNKESSCLHPVLLGMDSHAPMCMDPSKFVWLDAERNKESPLIWDWKMTSTTSDGGASGTILHVSGRIAFRHTDDAAYHNDFARYERLVSRQRCSNLLADNEADSVIQGSRNIYKAFGHIVQYKNSLYKGLQKITGKNNESAGRILRRDSGETWLDLGLADSFCQVAGIFLNSMTDIPDNDMYISDRIDGWIRSPKASTETKPDIWEVFACHQRSGDKECISDVFVFDPVHDELLEVILGIHYVKVSRPGLAKLLSRMSPSSNVIQVAPTSTPEAISLANGTELQHVPSQDVSKPVQTLPSKKEKKKKENTRPDISNSVRDLICNLSGLEPEKVKADSDLADLGIDSLMAMELAREIEIMFRCTLELSDLVDLTDFQSLINCINASLGFTEGSIVDEEEDVEQETLIEEMPHVNGIMPELNGDTGHANESTPAVNETQPHTNGFMKASAADTLIPATAILDSFAKTKQLSDEFIEDNSFANYAHHVLPKSTELCIVHIADGFEDLGCSLRNAKAGQVLNRIEYLPKHEKFVEFIYELLEKARLIDLQDSQITRTTVSVPAKSAEELLQELLRDSPDHAYDHRLTYLAGTKLADCLIGKADGLQLIFASAEGREIVSGMYGKSPINVAWIKQMEYFIKQFFLDVPHQSGPINILEMGAGTGGTTARLVTMLAELHVPFQYTVTDLSPSLVAAARKRFKQYPFMEFKVLDIENPPAADMLHSQHMVIATNCVHATHSLANSIKNIHDILRPDGYLMMLEMTETLPWIDLVFGLLEGWWLFDDGRRHALVGPSTWESTMKSVGYGHVDWTDGDRPENAIQRLIIGLASGQSHEWVPPPPIPLSSHTTDFAARQVVIDGFVEEFTRDFGTLDPSHGHNMPGKFDQCVLVTGATGSLGSHLVATFASLPSIKQVVCLNRKNTIEAMTRQRQALESKGIHLDPAALAKLEVFDTDTAKPMLGLSGIRYAKLVNTVTHIVHNAWPMSITRSTKSFENQFRVMQNLIDLAGKACCQRDPNAPRIGFQFISSIATVGYYPLWSGVARVPEDRVTLDSVMPTGYGDAKLICEKMLDETLHKYPEHFRPMTVRIGQIAGSKDSGYWNPVEHFAFLIKSSQTLKALPDFEGDLSWCPVNDVAAALTDLLISEVTPYPIYHIENPNRQSWREMIHVLADALDVPRTNIIPFEQWVDRVRHSRSSRTDPENPAGKIVDFFDAHFVRMSCGGLILDTTKSREHSQTLRNTKPVGRDLVMKYVRAWKERDFLS